MDIPNPPARDIATFCAYYGHFSWPPPLNDVANASLRPLIRDVQDIITRYPALATHCVPDMTDIVGTKDEEDMMPSVRDS